MNAMRIQVRKELRLLRTTWLAALGLALSPVVLCAATGGHGQGSVFIGMVFFYVGCALPAMELFGREFSAETFSALLSQPLTRRRLWWTKMAALALVSGSVLLVFVVATVQAASMGNWDMEPYWVALSLGVLLTVQGCALAFSVWTRLGAGVFWLSILMPVGVMGVMSLLMDWLTLRLGFGSVEAGWGLKVSLAVPLTMGLCGWVLAYRRALVMEDVGFLDREVDLSWLRRQPVAGAGGVAKPRSVTWQLVVKELRLQQVNVGLVVLFAAMMGAVFGLQDSEADPNAWVVTAMRTLWAMVWLLVPILVGGVAVADERRLGVTEWHMTLPVSRRRQWWIKVLVCFSVSFGLGVILPSLLEMAYLGEKFLAGEHVEFLVARLICWGLGTTVALYASSLSRHLLQALSATVFIGLLAAVACGLASARWGNDLLSLAGGLAVLALLPAMMSLSRRNHSAVYLDVRRVGRNVAVLAAALGLSGVVTAGLWNRSWEWFMTDPPAGPALTPKPGVNAGVRSAGGRVVVLTPDGRLWQSRWDETPLEFTLLSKDAAWRDVGVTAMSGVVAVKADGTLWHWGSWPTWTNRIVRTVNARYVLSPTAAIGSSVPQVSTNTVGAAMARSGMREMSVAEVMWITPPGPGPWRVGADSNWVAVAAGATHVVALRKDGTAWGWGDHRFGQLGGQDSEKHELPVQLPGLTNCIAVAANAVGTFAVTKDGAAWVWSKSFGSALVGPAGPRKITAGPVVRVGDWGGILGAVDATGRVLAWHFPSQGIPSLDAATLAARYGVRASAFSARVPSEYWLGDTTVRALSGSYGFHQDTWAVGTDGYLWRWDGDPNGDEGQATVLVKEFAHRVGARNDWLDVKGGVWGGGVAGLTADGCLWVWGTSDGQQEHPRLSDLLPPSLRPRIVARLTAE